MGILAACGLSAAIASYFHTSISIHYARTSIYALSAGALFLLGAIILWLILSGREEPPQAQTQDQAPSATDHLTRIALEHLADIRIQQTFNIDVARNLTLGAPNLPVSFESQRSWGTSWSLVPRTLPEIVERFRDFAAKISSHVPLLIGIDELDKLQSDKAEEFINSIKAVFGVQGCHFLISVSEDAAAGFERRGVPFRDVFDSSFDDVMTVGWVSRTTSAAILQSRVVGLSQPFIWLCHVLAGGLPRDLIRIARALLDPEYQNSETLAASARRLCRDELLGKTRGVCRALAKTPDDRHTCELLEYILLHDQPTIAAASHFRQSERLRAWILRVTNAAGAEQGTTGSAVRQARELATFAYFTATTCQFFDEGLTAEKLAVALADGDGWRSIEHLASARQAMAMSALDAERRVTEFRHAWRLTAPDEIRGWTNQRYQEFLQRLREAGAERQADAIEAAVARGGIIDRSDISHGSLKEFIQPIDRLMSEFREAGLAPADAPCPITPAYITTQQGSRRTNGFAVPADLIEIFTEE